MDLAALLAQRTLPWAGSRSLYAAQAVTDAGATLALNGRAIHVVVVNIGPNTAYLRFDGVAATSGIPLPVGVPYGFDVVGGTVLAFDSAIGETATVNVAQLLGSAP